MHVVAYERLKMKTLKLPYTLAAKVDAATRSTVENIATRDGLSIGEVTRGLIADGMRARGIECQ